MPDVIASALAKELYSYSVRHGPGQQHEAFFPFVKNYFVPSLGIPYIVPDNTYRPEILVAIDFNHTFVLAETDADGNQLPGQRPVSQETLQRVGHNLLQFFSYYFEYVLSYGKNWKKSPLYDALMQARVMGNNEEISLFINYLINFFITSVTVNKVSSGIGSATIDIRDSYNLTKDGKLRLFFDKTFNILSQLFAPMLPIMVWSKGRMYKDWTFPLFDGYITSISDSNTEGFTSLTLECRDSLELARVSYEMVQPSIIQVGERSTKEAINIFNKPFYGIDHFEIINAMFVGGSLKWDPVKGRIADITVADTDAKSKNKKSGYLSFFGLGNFGVATNATADGSGGTDEALDLFVENGAYRKDNFSLRKALELTKHTRKRFVSSWGSETTPYRIWNTQSVKTFESSFDSRLSIIQGVAEMVYYNLYVDGFGNVRYHPIRLGTDFLKYDLVYLKENNDPVHHERLFPGMQVIGPEEIISTSSSYNVEELKTFLHLEGFYPFSDADPRVVDLVGSYTATNLLRRFGYRRGSVTNPLFNVNPKLVTRDGDHVKFMDLAARELLMFENAQLYTRQDNIVFRPELEVASPLFIVPDREIFYVNSLTHNIPIGAEPTTSINSNFGRSELMPAPDLYTYIVKSENLYRVNTRKDQLPELPGLRFQTDFEKKFDSAMEYYDKKSKEISEGISSAFENPLL